jgi:hypothetical protein
MKRHDVAKINPNPNPLQIWKKSSPHESLVHKDQRSRKWFVALYNVYTRECIFFFLIFSFLTSKFGNWFFVWERNYITLNQIGAKSFNKSIDLDKTVANIVFVLIVTFDVFGYFFFPPLPIFHPLNGVAVKCFHSFVRLKSRLNNNKKKQQLCIMNYVFNYKIRN